MTPRDAGVRQSVQARRRRATGTIGTMPIREISQAAARTGRAACAREPSRRSLDSARFANYQNVRSDYNSATCWMQPWPRAEFGRSLRRGRSSRVAQAAGIRRRWSSDSGGPSIPYAGAATGSVDLGRSSTAASDQDRRGVSPDRPRIVVRHAWPVTLMRHADGRHHHPKPRADTLRLVTSFCAMMVGRSMQ
jgi:hypothetical protein